MAYMSVNSRPHQSEPVTITENDGFGGKQQRFTDVWYQYFSAIDGEINTTLVQNFTSLAYQQSSGQAVDRVQIEAIKKDISGIKASIAPLSCQLAEKNHKPNTDIRPPFDLSEVKNDINLLKRELSDIRALLSAKDGMHRIEGELSSLKALVAALQ